MALVSLDFGLGDEIDMLRNSVSAFARDEIAPLAGDVDRNDAFPMHLWRRLGDLGLLGITVDEAYGGSGM